MLGNLVLDQAEQPGRGADGLGDAEQVEVLLVPGVVDARDHLRDPVALLGDLRDDDVVLVVPGDGEHDLRRPRDPGPLEDVDLGRVAEQRHRPELGLELLEPVASLLDERHLVPHPQERAGHVRSDLASPCDDRVHVVLPARPDGARLARANDLDQGPDRRLCRAHGPQPALSVERSTFRIEDAHDDARRRVATLDDLPNDDVRVVAVGRDHDRIGARDTRSLENLDVHRVADDEASPPLAEPRRERPRPRRRT